jgi:endonuclease YncB( thermonuclease family)
MKDVKAFPSCRSTLLTALVVVLGAAALGVGAAPAFAGDSLYGKVTAVKGVDQVTLDFGDGQLDLRLVGIEVPKEGAAAERAVRSLSKMVLGKNARMRLEGRGPEGEMWVRLFTDDPELGIKDVSVELVRTGMVQRKKEYDFQYGELSAAESEAKSARRGLWATDQPR